MMEPFMRAYDTIVDFSCGANEWAPMLKKHLTDKLSVSPPSLPSQYLFGCRTN